MNNSIAFISDLHIKKLDRASDFRLTDDEFHEFLAALLKDHKFVVIVGDLFEAWQGRWPTRECAIEEIKKTKVAFPKSIKLINENKKLILVYGNHDVILSEIQLIKKRPINEFSLNDILAYHGTYDFINKSMPKTSMFFSWCAGLLEKKFGEDADEKIDIFFKGLGFRLFNSMAQFKEAKKKAMNNDVRYVINGHTHQAMVKTF